MIFSMLTLKSVAKSFGERAVLKSASLMLQPKDNVCIVGPSGSGKTTLLQLIVRVSKPTSGSVEVDGVDTKAMPPPILQLYRRRLGIIYQEPVLLTHATVRENIALPLELMGAPIDLINRNTDDLLKRMGLLEVADLLPEELPLGQRSLVGIARALITSPMIIVADEPFAHLDPPSIDIVSQMLLAMQKKGATMISLSRNPETATILSARTVQLTEGKLIASKKTAEQKASESQHRILEKSSKKVTTMLDDDPTSSAVAEGKGGLRGAGGKKEKDDDDSSGGKKIKITSIGSGA